MNNLSVTFTTCVYHPHRIALAVCECCKRPICIHDREIIRKDFSTRARSDPFHTYCKICYATILSKETDAFNYFALVILFYFLFYFVSIIATIQGNLFLIMNMFFITFIILSIIYGYIATKKVINAKSSSARLQEKAYLKENPETVPGFNYGKKDKEKALEKNNSPYDKSKEKYPSITCFECGSRFNIEDKYCDSCGYKEQDELLVEYNIFMA